MLEIEQKNYYPAGIGPAHDIILLNPFLILSLFLLCLDLLNHTTAINYLIPMRFHLRLQMRYGTRHPQFDRFELYFFDNAYRIVIKSD